MEESKIRRTVYSPSSLEACGDHPDPGVTSEDTRPMEVCRLFSEKGQ